MSYKRSKSKEDNSLNEPLKLETIIGLTTLNNAALSCSSQTGETFYAAGCVVDIMLMKINRKDFIK